MGRDRYVTIRGARVDTITHVTVGTTDYPVVVDRSGQVTLIFPRLDDLAGAKALGSGMTAHTLFGDVPLSKQVTVSSVEIGATLGRDRYVTIRGDAATSITYVTVGTTDYPVVVDRSGQVTVTIPGTDPNASGTLVQLTIHTLFGDQTRTVP